MKLNFWSGNLSLKLWFEVEIKCEVYVEIWNQYVDICPFRKLATFVLKFLFHFKTKFCLTFGLFLDRDPIEFFFYQKLSLNHAENLRKSWVNLRNFWASNPIFLKKVELRPVSWGFLFIREKKWECSLILATYLTLLALLFCHIELFWSSILGWKTCKRYTNWINWFFFDLAAEFGLESSILSGQSAGRPGEAGNKVT